jgi:hypothetical protein
MPSEGALINWNEESKIVQSESIQLPFISALETVLSIHQDKKDRCLVLSADMHQRVTIWDRRELTLQQIDIPKGSCFAAARFLPNTHFILLEDSRGNAFVFKVPKLTAELMPVLTDGKEIGFIYAIVNVGDTVKIIHTTQREGISLLAILDLSDEGLFVETQFVVDQYLEDIKSLGMINCVGLCSLPSDDQLRFAFCLRNELTQQEFILTATIITTGLVKTIQVDNSRSISADEKGRDCRHDKGIALLADGRIIYLDTNCVPGNVPFQKISQTRVCVFAEEEKGLRITHSMVKAQHLDKRDWAKFPFAQTTLGGYSQLINYMQEDKLLEKIDNQGVTQVSQIPYFSPAESRMLDSISGEPTFYFSVPKQPTHYIYHEIIYNYQTLIESFNRLEEGIALEVPCMPKVLCSLTASYATELGLFNRHVSQKGKSVAVDLIQRSVRENRK